MTEAGPAGPSPGQIDQDAFGRRNSAGLTHLNHVAFCNTNQTLLD